MTDIRLVTIDDEQKLKKFYNQAYGENHILNNLYFSNFLNVTALSLIQKV